MDYELLDQSNLSYQNKLFGRLPLSKSQKLRVMMDHYGPESYAELMKLYHEEQAKENQAREESKRKLELLEAEHNRTSPYPKRERKKVPRFKPY